MIAYSQMDGFVLLPVFISWSVISSLHLITVSSIIVGLLFRILYTTVLYPEVFTPFKEIPTPPGRSLLRGNIAPHSATSQVARLRSWRATVPNNGLIRYYQNGNQERLLVTSPKALNEILVSNAASFGKPESVRRRLLYATGDGLLLAEGEEHKVQRKSLMPAFTFRHIKDLYPAFWSKARELTKCLEKEAGVSNSTKTKVIEIRGWATRTTLDIIGLTGMDHDFGSLLNPSDPVTRQYQQMRQEPSHFEGFVRFILSLVSTKAAGLLSRLPTKRMKQVRASSLYLRTVCKDVIQKKQNKLNTCPPENEVDIISIALRSTTFTSDSLVDQMMTFLAAGHGTTSRALQWAVYALCKHKDIQTRLRQEVRDHLPSISDTESSVSAAHIDSLSYLHSFCNEVLRFYPPIPFTARQALQDTTLAGYHIPKGTKFTLSPAVTNLDPELWGPDAHIFDPERWMHKGCLNTGGVQSHVGFLTFLHGPRNCIGSTFAKSELACLVAALVGRFRMELEDPNKKEELTMRGVGLSPLDGVRAKFEVVDGW